MLLESSCCSVIAGAEHRVQVTWNPNCQDSKALQYSQSTEHGVPALSALTGSHGQGHGYYHKQVVDSGWLLQRYSGLWWNWEMPIIRAIIMRLRTPLLWNSLLHCTLPYFCFHLNMLALSVCCFYSPSCLCFQIGERIRVILDMEDKTLAFERGYEFLGVAFRGLPKVCLYPAVSAVYGNTEVTLVYLGKPLDGWHGLFCWDVEMWMFGRRNLHVG